jgi:hypothetical protein
METTPINPKKNQTITQRCKKNSVGVVFLLWYGIISAWLLSVSIWCTWAGYVIDFNTIVLNCIISILCLLSIFRLCYLYFIRNPPRRNVFYEAPPSLIIFGNTVIGLLMLSALSILSGKTLNNSLEIGNIIYSHIVPDVEWIRTQNTLGCCGWNITIGKLATGNFCSNQRVSPCLIPIISDNMYVVRIFTDNSIAITISQLIFIIGYLIYSFSKANFENKS